MPWYLTMGALLGALCVAVLSREPVTGVLPAVVVLVLVLAAFAAAVWIAVGGLAMGVERTDAARIAYEVGPGVALVGLLCTLISYYGRHHPNEPGQPL